MSKPFFLVFRLPYVLAVCLLILPVAAFVGGYYFYGSKLAPNASVLSYQLAGKVVVVDAGHGGFDPGAVGYNGTLEKDLTLTMASRLANLLREGGAVVVETRTDDTALGNTKKEDMHRRVEISEEAGAGLFLTLQANSTPHHNVRGAQIFYARGNEDSKNLAVSIQTEIVRLLRNTDRVALPIDNIYVLKNQTIPAVVVEVGFISNAAEEKLLNDEAYQSRMVWAIYSGIVNYYLNDSGVKENNVDGDKSIFQEVPDTSNKESGLR